MRPRRFLSICLPPPQAAAPADLTRLALWCQCFSPLTAPDPPDGLLLDVSGCAHLFGGEAGLLARLAARFPGARMAAADTALAAWALARYAAPGATDISPLPLAALRLPERTIMRLRRVGVLHIKELMRLPRAELTAGYGPEPLRQLARALGHAPEPLNFVREPPDWCETEPYAEPIFVPAQLRAALARLSAKLCAKLEHGGRGATALAARFYRIDRQRPEITLGFASACRDEHQISKLLSEKLASIDPGFGVEAMSLEAVGTEPLQPEQHGSETVKMDFSVPINTLLNRLGPAKLWRVVPHASYIPEYAARRAKINAAPVSWPRPAHPRPVRLLPQPDAITAIALVPDDPPVFFTWRGQGHRIAHATGPERIARDWWCHPHDNTRPEAEKIRDYYAVEDTQGARFWLFRAGLHPARWYVHGFFG